MFKKGEKAYLIKATNELPASAIVTFDRYGRSGDDLVIVTSGGGVFFEDQLHPAHESVMDGKKDDRQIWADRMMEDRKAKTLVRYNYDLREKLTAEIRKLPIDLQGHFRRGKDLSSELSDDTYICVETQRSMISPKRPALL